MFVYFLLYDKAWASVIAQELMAVWCLGSLSWIFRLRDFTVDVPTRNNARAYDDDSDDESDGGYEEEEDEEEEISLEDRRRSRRSRRNTSPQSTTSSEDRPYSESENAIEMQLIERQRKSSSESDNDSSSSPQESRIRTRNESDRGNDTHTLILEPEERNEYERVRQLRRNGPSSAPRNLSWWQRVLPLVFQSGPRLLLVNNPPTIRHNTLQPVVSIATVEGFDEDLMFAKQKE